MQHFTLLPQMLQEVSESISIIQCAHMAACDCPYVLFDVLECLLQQFLLRGSQSCPRRKAVNQHGRLSLPHAHHKHEDQQVVEDDAEEVVFLQTKCMSLFLRQCVVSVHHGKYNNLAQR